ncbi:MAG TPA: beta-ketoacyl synthase chain length factor [Steroidobacteraceae bacterium]|jgi:hypothetical protein|nr:beta-ketoacyl synthase chain length factor [Steroidobacteraceae bacterium]
MLWARVAGIGLLGPGLDGWPAAAEVLRSQGSYRRAATVIPALAVLPPAERRRSGRVVRVALAIGAEAVTAAGADPRRLPSVFTSSGGDGDNCHEICVTLAGSERQISPTRFHNSVHNAAAGYWSIAYGCTEPSTALCAYDGSFGAGLLEALAQLACGAEATLLVSYDLDYPPPLRSHRPIGDAFGVALLLRRAGQEPAAHPEPAADPAPPAAPRLCVDFTDAAPTAMADAALEALRREIPAARALPLLELLAAERGGRVVLDYLQGTRLEVQLEAGT